MTDDELNRIEERANEATPDEWTKHNHNKYSYAVSQFTAHGRKDVPKLIAEVRQLKAERDAIINLLIKYDHCPDNFYVCPHKECCKDDKSCWLTWARNEVRKAEQT